MISWLFLFSILLPLSCAAPFGPEETLGDDEGVFQEFTDSKNFILLDSLDHIIKIYPAEKPTAYETDAEAVGEELETFSVSDALLNNKLVPLNEFNNDKSVPSLSTETKIVYSMLDGEPTQLESIVKGTEQNQISQIVADNNESPIDEINIEEAVEGDEISDTVTDEPKVDVKLAPIQTDESIPEESLPLTSEAPEALAVLEDDNTDQSLKIGEEEEDHILPSIDAIKDEITITEDTESPIETTLIERKEDEIEVNEVADTTTEEIIDTQMPVFTESDQSESGSQRDEESEAIEDISVQTIIPETELITEEPIDDSEDNIQITERNLEYSEVREENDKEQQMIDMKHEQAVAFMIDFNRESAIESQRVAYAQWDFSTNITDFRRNLLIRVKERYAKVVKKQHGDLQIWQDSLPLFNDEYLNRQFKLYSSLGSAILPEEKLSTLIKLKTEMQEIYSTAQICDYFNSTKCDLSLDPDIEIIFKKSRDPEELAHVWTAWRDASGKKMKKLFEDSAKIGNEAAVLNGFETLAEQWNDDYEDENFEIEIAELFKSLQPLYDQLHAYTRRNLRDEYGADKITKEGPIPAHLLGNMWSQTWDNLYDILIPYPNKTSFDVTDSMIQQGYTPTIMFEKADDFFASLGLRRVEELFWKKSVIEKPSDRKIVCHASAWDFSDGQDFRIKQCTKVNMADFFTVHHEMGHIQYYLQYHNLPHALRGGANSGFHEAVGDLISLSVSTPKHLKKIGLLESFEEDPESDINFLLSSALSSVAFLPFGYLVDKWRWDAFRGIVTPENYTCSWWDYRYNLQGIQPPVQRSELDFDPGAKFHIAAYSRYIAYFVSRILTFQFHKTVCTLANEYEPGNPNKPLHKCDIHESKEAGRALGEMLKLGKSQHWRKTLESFTGTPNITVEPLLEYFQPLMDWLKTDNEKHQEFIGWKGGNDFCTTTVN